MKDYDITMLVLIKCNQNAMGNNYMPLIILYIDISDIYDLIIDQTLRLIWVMPIV